MKRVRGFRPWIVVSTAAALVFFTSSIYAADSNARKLKELQERKKDLSAAYQNKQKELSEITLKIHEIDDQIAQLRQTH